MSIAKVDLTGKRFGRFVVLGLDTNKKISHDRYWICKCDCGNIKSVTTGHLVAGTVASCGCLRKEQAIERFQKAAKDKMTHGETHTTLYNIWHLMKQRCTNPNASGFEWYGAKGVKVCEEWKDYENFAKWAYSNGYEDFQDLPRSQKLSIDRIDSNGDYCPENCRFITISENSRRVNEKKQIRNGKIKKMREEGKSLDFIALHFGISKARVAQICNYKEDRWNLNERGFGELPTRVALSLLRTGIKNKDDLIEKLNNGVPVMNIGQKGIQEIEKLVKRQIIETYEYKDQNNKYKYGSIRKFLKYREV